MPPLQPILALGTPVSGHEDEPAVSGYLRVNVWGRVKGSRAKPGF